jgi:hypothetical protein
MGRHYKPAKSQFTLLQFYPFISYSQKSVQKDETKYRLYSIKNHNQQV